MLKLLTLRSPSELTVLLSTKQALRQWPLVSHFGIDCAREHVNMTNCTIVVAPCSVGSDVQYAGSINFRAGQGIPCTNPVDIQGYQGKGIMTSA